MAQQLLNKDPEPIETRDWNQPYWEGVDWNSWEYYFGPYMPGYGENIPLTQEKGKGEGGKPLGGWSKAGNPPTTRADPVGDAYGVCNWSLKTNERSMVKQMPLLSEFPSYSELGEEARRWAETLYNHPISSVIDYFVVNFIASTNRIDNESGGAFEI